MRTIVYRVQDEHGHGPYCGPRGAIWLGFPTTRRWNRHESLPTHRDEFPERQHERADGCCFVSLEQLAAWFEPADRTELQKYGFYPYKIAVAKVIASSERQAIFKRRLVPLTEDCARLSWESVPA